MFVGVCGVVGKYEFGIPLEPDAVFVKLSDLVSVINREDKPPDNVLPPAETIEKLYDTFHTISLYLQLILLIYS